MKRTGEAMPCQQSDMERIALPESRTGDRRFSDSRHTGVYQCGARLY